MNVFFGIVLFSCLLFGCNSIQNYFKPRISGRYYENILQVGQNITFTCEGNEPLEWKLPDFPENKFNYTSFTTSTDLPSDLNYKFASSLHIWNMTYQYIGFYYCLHQNSSIKSVRDNDKIYLYVEDNDHLSLYNETYFYVTQYSEATIPCLKTGIDVKVELRSEDDMIIKPNIPRDPFNTIYKFHNHYGYKTNDTIHNGERLYICEYFKHLPQRVITQSQILVMSVQPINDLKGQHLELNNTEYPVVGKTLSIKCSVESLTSDVQFHWDFPNKIIDKNRRSFKRSFINNQAIEVVSIKHANLKDEGLYTCNITDLDNNLVSSSLHVKIYDSHNHFIYLTEENNVYNLTLQAGQLSADWSIQVDALPSVKLQWFNNQNQSIINSNKFESKISTKKAFLSIKNISIFDHGFYILRAKNKYETKELRLFLNVTDKPTVKIEGKTSHMIYATTTLRCLGKANPAPQIIWEFKNCQDDSCNFTKINSQNRLVINDVNFTSYLEIEARKSGLVRCLAENIHGIDEFIAEFYVTDIPNGFGIFGLPETVEFDSKSKVATIALNDSFSMTCGGSVYKFSEVNWFRQGLHIPSYNSTENEFSIKKLQHLENVQFEHSGSYQCQGESIDNQTFLETIILNISAPIEPTFLKTDFTEKIEGMLPEKLELVCEVSGLPKPSIRWYKNNQTFVPQATKNILVKEDLRNITFKATESEDEGIYECEATNRLGSISRTFEVKFKNKPKFYYPYYIVITVILSILFLLALSYIIYKQRKERKLKMELKQMGLENFEAGGMENFNPELGIEDQAELLPYDKKWEFPIKNLKLGKQLGSGAFGVVMKATAENILINGESTVVAVKMVKQSADNMHLKALASELKIMAHLGKHLNVVNLLGACTKNVIKKELMVIVEYCRFGNLQSFLLKQRDTFINELNENHQLIYIQPDFSDQTSSVSNNKRPSQVSSILSTSSTQPKWRSNYHGDYKESLNPISTKDLLCWSFQITKGMDYLASRKIMHGDLAARNILLAEDDIIKIADFGLAKNMYKNDNYKKESDGLFPIKWMAIESIRDRIFSTQSDVWSFGIVLWELFSLARTPYPGMEPDERLFHKLVGGYRMEAPEFAPKEIYQLMKECWEANPMARPSFKDLGNRITTFLDQHIVQRLFAFNDCYSQMNKFQDGETDYLNMLISPDYQNLSSPIGVESVEFRENCKNKKVFHLEEMEITECDRTSRFSAKPKSYQINPNIYKNLQEDYQKYLDKKNVNLSL